MNARQMNRRVAELLKIPLDPPLRKGEEEIAFGLSTPPLLKGGEGGFVKPLLSFYQH